MQVRTIEQPLGSIRFGMPPTKTAYEQAARAKPHTEQSSLFQWIWTNQPTIRAATPAWWSQLAAYLVWRGGWQYRLIGDYQRWAALLT
ncbi:MAG: hypothetical protein ACYC5O_11415 [Anaerolineae bacterium]